MTAEEFAIKVVIILAVIVTGIVMVSLLLAIPINYEYNANIGSYFELSDKASKLDTKLEYLKQYREALKQNGLDSGQTTILFPTRETSLEENFKVLDSLIIRMEEIKGMPIDSFQYQTAMQQITENEYCWFHANVFSQGFLLKRGFWPLAFSPSSPYNRCRSSD